MSWRKACTTAGAIATLGDIGMQLREQQVSTKRAVALADVDSGRTARIVAYRVLQAPLVELSWRALDSRLPLRGAAHAALVVGADQLFLLPTWTAIFYYSQSAMEGRSHGEGAERVRDKFWPTITAGVPFYTCVHAVTFGVLPPQLRLAWFSTCGVLWNAFLSSTNEDAAARARDPLRRAPPAIVNEETEEASL